MKRFERKHLGIKILTTILCLLLSLTASYARIKGLSSLRYEIEGVGTGKPGTFLVKVCIYSKKPNVTPEQIKYAAVHGVIFKGFSGDGFASQKALAKPEIESQKSDFFNSFWENGDYLAYATIVNSVADRVKISNKQYKLGAVVSVSKDSLRKYLENIGIIRGLNTGF